MRGSLTKQLKRLLSLVLVACLLLSSVNIADAVDGLEATSEETTTVEETTTTLEESTTVAEEESSEESTTTSEETSETKASETEATEAESTETTETTETTEEAIENETTTTTATSENETTTTEAATKATTTEATTTEATTTTDPVSTSSETNEIVKEEVQVSTISEVSSATASELTENTFGYDPMKYYDVIYHFVMPDDASSRGSYWRNAYDIERYRTEERRYWIGEKYDETATKTNANDAGSQMGMLCNVDLSAILKGYELIGWNTDENAAKAGIKTYDISPAKDTPLTEENNITINLYSTFELIPMTIKFDINDSTKGTGSTQANKSVFTEQTIHLGDTLSFLDDAEYTDATISRPGYDFMGWSRECYNSIWRNLEYDTDERYPITPFRTVTSDTTFNSNTANGDINMARGNTYILYAVWQPKAYHIKVHWPRCPEFGNLTYEQYLEYCKNADAIDQWVIFDNDFEVDQSLNHIKGEDSLDRNWVLARIPREYLLGIGTDPNCIDASSVVWTYDAYWGHLIPEDLTPGSDGFVHLYCILVPNVYANSVNVKINLDGGYHRGWLSYDLRVTAGTSYMQSLYPGLMSNLEKPGYIYDKTVKVNPDGSEEDFDFNQTASISDKSQESLDALAAYNKWITPVEEAYEVYYKILTERLNLQHQYIPEGGGGMSWEEFAALPEAKEILDRENAAYDAYLEVAKNLPDSRDYWDLYLKIKWKGKNLEGKFDYHGNRGNSYKVGPAEVLNITSKTVTYGKPIGELPRPTKTGYTFNGWKTGRGLGDQELWKDVTEDTIFESAEKDEPFLFGLKYDEKQFTFYANWKPISLNAGVQNDAEHANANVTMNDFKFGEETTLNVQGTYKVSNNSRSTLFGTGAGEEQEAYGIEVLNDFWTDNGTPVRKQVAGTKYYNGEKVTLYGTAENPLRVKPLWRTKQTSSDNTNNNNDNKDNNNTDNKDNNNNANIDSDNSHDDYDNSSKDNGSSNNSPSNSNPSNNSPSSTTPTNNSPSNTSPSGTAPSGGSTGSTGDSSAAAAPAALQNKATENKPQQTLQQTISNGNFAKASINTSNLYVHSIVQGTNNWITDPQTGKYKLTGVIATGQTVTVTNSFAQVSRTVTEGAQAGMTVNDTYFFDANGDMVTGWMQTQDGKWYFFDDTKGANEGKMSLGWTKVANSWYYFTSNGSMLTNGTTPDGFKVNADGTWTQV